MVVGGEWPAEEWWGMVSGREWQACGDTVKGHYGRTGRGQGWLVGGDAEREWRVAVRDGGNGKGRWQVMAWEKFQHFCKDPKFSAHSSMMLLDFA